MSNGRNMWGGQSMLSRGNAIGKKKNNNDERGPIMTKRWGTGSVRDAPLVPWC